MICFGSDHIAERLRHRPALAVHDKPVGQDGLERGLVFQRDRGDQRDLEPAAMLIGPFQVHVRRISEFRPSFDSSRRRPRKRRIRTTHRKCPGHSSFGVRRLLPPRGRQPDSKGFPFPTTAGGTNTSPDGDFTMPEIRFFPYSGIQCDLVRWPSSAAPADPCARH